MNIALLFGLFSEEILEEVSTNSKGGVQYAANALQQAIVQGFLDNGVGTRVKLLNLPFVGTYPKNYRLFKSSSFDFSITGTNGSIQGQNLGFCHLVGWQLISRYLHAKRALLKWAETTPGKKVVISYNIHTPFLKAAVAVKKDFPDIHICQIAPDLAEYMATDKGLYAMLRRVNCGLQRRLFRHVDSYVLLSKYMADRLPVGDKPWAVVEGIYRNIDDDVSVNKEINKTILYTGSLDYRNGILDLLNAFNQINDNAYRLWLRGNASPLMMNEIRKRQKNDSRIIYFKPMSRLELYRLQKRATILINPIRPSQKHTKYFFPSKTMEYMASGTPVVMYKLDCLPEEYHDFIFFIKDESIQSLKDKILEVCNINQEEINDFVEKSNKFILSEKNPKKQCKKILDLIQY